MPKSSIYSAITAIRVYKLHFTTVLGLIESAPDAADVHHPGASVFRDGVVGSVTAEDAAQRVPASSGAFDVLSTRRLLSVRTFPVSEE